MESRGESFACALEENELADRMQAWDEVVQQATNRRVEAGRIVATYPKDAQLLARLRDLIAAEGDCCSFLQFRLDEKPDSIVMELRFPDNLPDAMSARFSRATRPA